MKTVSQVPYPSPLSLFLFTLHLHLRMLWRTIMGERPDITYGKKLRGRLEVLFKVDAHRELLQQSHTATAYEVRRHFLTATICEASPTLVAEFPGEIQHDCV